jgi:hypothetical protein
VNEVRGVSGAEGSAVALRKFRTGVTSGSPPHGNNTEITCLAMQIVAESWQMKWLIVPLAIQTIAGIALAFRSVSLNTWESDEGIHNPGDRLSLVTGIVFLSGAGLGWYGYSQTQAWCWGFTGLRLVKTCVDAIGLVLLYFVFFRTESTTPPEAQEEH